MKIFLVIIGVLLIIGGAVYFLPRGDKTVEPIQQERPLDPTEGAPAQKKSTTSITLPSATTLPQTLTRPVIKGTSGQAVSSGAKIKKKSIAESLSE